MSRLSPVAALAALLLIVAACGASPNPTPTASKSPISSGGTSVLPTIVSSELGVGPNRVLVSVLDPTGTKPAGSPDRKVSVGFRGPGGETVAVQPSTFIWAIQPSGAIAGVGVYVVHATFPAAGAWTAEFTTSAPGSPEATIPFGFVDGIRDTLRRKPSLLSVAVAAAFRQRASQAEVTRAAYAQFGPGRRIICVAQTSNGDRWNCRSLRWGDDPACRQATVSLTGTIHISRQTVICEA